MVITDKIYGKVEVDSAAIAELIDSKSLQRLKHIGQFGIPDEFYHLINFSRYDHSVGVMLLLRKLGASEEEQIAGLLHDVSHTAFSHTIDWVLGEGGNEEYQDEQHQSFMNRSEIPAILARHGFSVDRIADYHHFGLLERDLPDLCADRIDYSLREFPLDVAKQCVPAITVASNQIAFTDIETAKLFGDHFLKRQNEHWGGFEAVSRYRIFADTLRLALKDKTITMADFWEDDDYVVTKLKASKNKTIQSLLELLRSPTLTHLDKSNTILFKKFRHVNPHFLQEGQLIRLNEANEDYARDLAEARKHNERGVIIPVVPTYL